MLFPNSRNSDIELTFNPSRPNGLILYSGNHSRNRDFISISLLERYIHLRFDLGSGPVNLMSLEPVELEDWHTVYIARNGRFASLRVDDQQIVSDESPGVLQELNVLGDVSLGGVKAHSIVSPLSGLVVGFTGCIQSMQVIQ